jgi:hypothetical protein
MMHRIKCEHKGCKNQERAQTGGDFFEIVNARMLSSRISVTTDEGHDDTDGPRRGDIFGDGVTDSSASAAAAPSAVAP